MFRHFAPVSVRVVTIALALAPWLTSTSIASSSDPSSASEWAALNSPLTFDLRDGVRLTLAPGSKLVRQPGIPVPRHLKDVAPRAYAVEIVTGRVDVDIDTKRKPIYSVMVRGPRRTAAFSTGGRITVWASTQGIVLAAVTATEMSASANDKWRSLRVGTALVVNREMPTGAVHDLLKAPTLQVSNSLRLSIGNSESTTLSWNTIPEAQTYRVSIRRQAPKGSEPVSDYDVKTNSFALPQLETGTYTATVAAVDRWQMDSPPSREVGFRVVGVTIPEGAYLLNGIPQLSKYQQVSLSQTEGLEVAYGSGTTFEPAPNSLGVPAGRPILVRLRAIGSTQEVALRLEPRSIQSSIEFEPKGARWPGQAIKVVVRVSGPNGTDLPDSVNVTLNATVNTRPVETKWAHEGHIWQTRIEQPPLAGPWVLRIDAKDQGGQILAHDFLEIAEAHIAPAREIEPKRRYAFK